MNIAIIGYGDQGRSAYEYWDQPENTITICDGNTDITPPDGALTHLGSSYLSNLSAFDLIIRSPGVHPRELVSANDESILEKVTTVTNEFLRVCPTKNVIGVTGTKGKGTTSTLIAQMLRASGRSVHLGGNIGIPPLDLLHETISEDDWVVLELANFQLIDLAHSPHIAVCLMVVPEHLDWHHDVNEYYEAKSRLFINQRGEDISIYYAENTVSQEIAAASGGTLIPFYRAPGAYVDNDCITIQGHEILPVENLRLLGKHNWQNVCAAVTAVWQITQDIPALQTILTSFTGLEHRLDHVRTYEDVDYYDDSFGTTPETAIVAMEAFVQPKVLILGGSDKGASYDELARAVISNNVRHVLLIGEQASRINDALRTFGYVHALSGGNTMEEIVATAHSLAEPHDVVLLSTGCASFDMFKNYKDRGEQFKQAVLAL